MTLHRNRFLVNKTNRCTEFQFYWYYYSTCFGEPFCPSSGVIRRTSALVHFMQLWWRFLPGVERLPETCTVVIPIKLEFSASVGFIHKKYRWICKMSVTDYKLKSLDYEAQHNTLRCLLSSNISSITHIKMYAYLIIRTIYKIILHTAANWT